MTVANIGIHPLSQSDHDWVARRTAENWGAEIVVAHGTVFRPADLPGFYAEAAGEKLGLLTYHIDGESCEIVSIEAWQEGLGIGTVLIEAARHAAIQAGCHRLWLITTNDNTNALRFYQKRGFSIAAIHINALEYSRKLKPEIPELGNDGIPIRDEIELEMKI